MGNWVMVVEGTGIHDNGLEHDAEALLKEFAAKLAQHHTVHSVTFTAGGTRELINTAPASPSEPHLTVPLRSGHPHEYRHRNH